MSSKPSKDPSKLGLLDIVSITVGIVIGAGVFETAPLIFATLGHPGWSLGMWAVGGLLSLVGALCYAELASTYPKSGGDYVYLSMAYGAPVGFLFGWAQLAVILAGSIRMMAYIFADYAVEFWRLQPKHTYLMQLPLSLFCLF